MDILSQESEHLLNKLTRHMNEEQEQGTAVPYQQIQSIMQKSYKERSDDDLKLMDKYLNKNQFFSNLKKECDKEAIFESIRVLTLQKFQLNDSVFNFGDYGKEFYVILNGKVSVQVPTQIHMKCSRKELFDFLIENFDKIIWKKIENGESLREQAQHEKDLYTEKVEVSHRSIVSSSREGHRQIHIKQEISEMYQDEMNLQIWIFKEVAQLTKGKSFGELALLTFKPRAANIICLEQTDLAVMDKSSYEKVVGKALKRKIKEKVVFLKNFRILSHIPETQLQRLIYYLKETKVSRGTVMYKGGQPTDGLYLIKHGSFELIKDINLKKEVETFISQSKPTDMTMGQRLSLKKTAQLRQDSNKGKLRVAILGVGEVFGLEECNDEALPPRKNTIVCNENDSIVYFISQQDFKERLQGDKVLQDIQVENEMKKVFYRFRKEQIKIFSQNEFEMDLNELNSGSPEPTTIKIKEYFKNQSKQEYQQMIKNHFLNNGSNKKSIDATIDEDDEMVKLFRKNKQRLRPLESLKKEEKNRSASVMNLKNSNQAQNKTLFNPRQKSVDLSAQQQEAYLNDKMQQESQKKEDDKKLYRQLSSKSFYQIINESLKKDQKGGIDAVKMIDNLKNLNEKLWLQNKKINDFEAELKNLEGESSAKNKRKLVEVKRKIEREYSPEKIRNIGRNKSFPKQFYTDDKKIEGDKTLEVNPSPIFSKDKESQIIDHTKSHQMLPTKKSLSNFGPQDEYQTFSQMFLNQASKNSQTQFGQSSKDLTAYNNLGNQSSLDYINNNSVIQHYLKQPQYTFREVDSQKQFLPTYINASYIQMMRKGLHSKNKSDGSSIQQKKQQVSKNLFQQYTMNNILSLHSSEGIDRMINKNVQQLQQQQQQQQQNKSASFYKSKRDEIINFRNKIVIKFNHSQMRTIANK